MASRILGMGDVLTLIEKAQNAVDEKEMERLQKSFRENTFTLQDYLQQIENVNKMGDINAIMDMIPGLRNKMGNVSIDEKEIARNKAIIQSMTPQERFDPDCIKAGQKKRIAQGSGTSIQEVNILLKQFNQSKELMKQYGGKKGKKMKFPF